MKLDINDFITGLTIGLFFGIFVFMSYRIGYNTAQKDLKQMYIIKNCKEKK
jgi:hypothetical protein